MNALVTVVKMMKCDVFSLKIPISSVSNYRLLNELAGNLISIEYLDQRKMLRGTLNSYHEDVLSPVFHKSKNRNSNIYEVMIITYILTFISHSTCQETLLDLFNYHIASLFVYEMFYFFRFLSSKVTGGVLYTRTI